MNQDVIDYILHFLVQDDKFEQYDMISYGNMQNKKGLLIRQSDFFKKDIYGGKASLPVLPLRMLEDVPVLFGEPLVEENEMGIIIHADFIASSYFLLSRYEEWVRPEIRDEHGRFPGRESVSYRAGTLDRPIVDEYGRILRKYLRRLGCSVTEPEEKYASVTLTHDIDHPWTNYSFPGAVRRMLGSLRHQKKLIFYPMMNCFHQYSWDPYNIFEKIIRLDRGTPYKNIEIVFFAIAGVAETIKGSFDYLPSKGFKKILSLIEQYGCRLELHISYEAGEDVSLIYKEKEKLERITGKQVKVSRHHYLRAREPQDMRRLLEAGITEDYTMTYADVAGFRLGTARKVQWIDPVNMELTPLVLHPLQIMDVTLNERQYMNLTLQEATEYCKRIMGSTRRVHGDLCLLWHNTTLAANYPCYTRELYEDLLQELI